MNAFTPFSGTRTGKIARLPRLWRDELNRRLDDGVPVKHLMAWLNAEPEVRAILAAEFQGRPINEQNICAWKRGGFLDWQRMEAVGGWVEGVIEAGADLKEATGGCDLHEMVSMLALVTMGRMVEESWSEGDLTKKSRVVLGVTRELTKIKRTQANVEHARWARARVELREARESSGAKIEPPQAVAQEGDQGELSQIKVAEKKTPAQAVARAARSGSSSRRKQHASPWRSDSSLGWRKPKDWSRS